jgi:hypothetical protein
MPMRGILQVDCGGAVGRAGNDAVESSAVVCAVFMIGSGVAGEPFAQISSMGGKSDGADAMKNASHVTLGSNIDNEI